MKRENLRFSDLELIFKDLKSLFEKGFIINWKALRIKVRRDYKCFSYGISVYIRRETNFIRNYKS